MVSFYVKAILLQVVLALLLLCLTAAASKVPAPGTPFSDVLFIVNDDSAATPSPTAEAEVNQHVGRTAAIFFSVCGGAWLILSLCVAYYFVCVCPNRHTK
jgi:hypothetical protein